jgi:heptosyltransferase I
VPRDLHAVLRNRLLCGHALGYSPGENLDYGLRLPAGSDRGVCAERYVVFLHATSHPSKLWSEANWVELGSRYAAAGCRAILPWGSSPEHERARRIAAAVPGAIVAERMELDAIAAMLARAVAVVGVDTGLTHLAAALDRPVIGIYGMTSPGTTGVYAHARARNVGSGQGFPGVAEVVAALGSLGTSPDDLAAAGAS